MSASAPLAQAAWLAAHMAGWWFAIWPSLADGHGVSGLGATRMRSAQVGGERWGAPSAETGYLRARGGTPVWVPRRCIFAYNARGWESSPTHDPHRKTL